MKILALLLFCALALGAQTLPLPKPQTLSEPSGKKALLAGALGAIGGAIVGTQALDFSAVPAANRRAREFRAGLTYGAIGGVLAAGLTARFAEPQVPEPHRFFWDKWNTPLLLGVAAVQTLDFTSTRYFRDRSKDEWLLTNKLVDNRPAFLATEISAASSAIALSYLFHRSGHHGWERAIAVAYIAFGAVSAWANYRYPKTGHALF